MEHSAIFEKAVMYYEEGRWKKSYIRALTRAGHLTPAEYEENTGEEYE